MIDPADARAAAAMPRPSVLSLNINSKSALYAAFMPTLRTGGIFIPTTRPYNLGDEVFMLLALMTTRSSCRSPAQSSGSRRRERKTARRKASVCISRTTRAASRRDVRSKACSVGSCNRRARRTRSDPRRVFRLNRAPTPRRAGLSLPDWNPPFSHVDRFALPSRFPRTLGQSDRVPCGHGHTRGQPCAVRRSDAGAPSRRVGHRRATCPVIRFGGCAS